MYKYKIEKCAGIHAYTYAFSDTYFSVSVRPSSKELENPEKI